MEGRQTMKFSAILLVLAALVLGLAGTASKAKAQTQPSPAEVLSTAAGQQRFVFVLFWKQRDEATDAVAHSLRSQLGAYTDRAASVAVLVNDPAQQEVVNRFGVSRAPTPLVLAVAPNGAVTGAFQAPLTVENIENSLVTPTMAACLKSMQEGKVVVMLVDPRGDGKTPRGLDEYFGDSHFRQRSVFVRLASSNPHEARLMQKLQVSESEARGCVVVMAPPGSIVGKFPLTASGKDLISKLHAAGKCCDDPNCKHNH
jgi:hypothetical protein